MGMGPEGRQEDRDHLQGWKEPGVWASEGFEDLRGGKDLRKGCDIT